MVISLEPDPDDALDQIRYSGNPDEFVWVLPIVVRHHNRAGQRRLLHPAPATHTAPVVSWGGSYPNRSCPYYGGAQSVDARTADGGVTVFQESVVGPYETSPWRSTDPAALHTWLTDHNYNVPPEAEPVIAYYVQQKERVHRAAPAARGRACRPCSRCA